MTTRGDVFGSVVDAVQTTLDELDLDAEDRAASVLALRVAEAIDEEESGRSVAELARQLLAVLESLGATPAARKALMKGVQPDVGAKQRSALDELRERRDRRAHGASSVDASSS